MKRPFLLVCGPRGVGKSSIGFQVFLDVMQSGIKVAYVDLDQVAFCRPIPEGDPDNHRVRLRNLARIWSVYQHAGATCLIATGDVHNPEVIDAYAAAVPTLAMSVCRLDADVDSLRERLLARGRGEGPPVPGDELRGESVARLTQRAEVAASSPESLSRRLIGDVHVVTDGQTVAEAAASVRAKLGGWPTKY